MVKSQRGSSGPEMTEEQCGKGMGSNAEMGTGPASTPGGESGHGGKIAAFAYVAPDH